MGICDELGEGLGNIRKETDWMKDLFYLHFDTMPKATAQQKGVRIQNGKPFFYEKGNVRQAQHEFAVALKPHRPNTPSERPIRLTIWFAFDTKNKKLWCKDMPKEDEAEWSGFVYKPTRPDTDNYLKLFKDVMTDCGFWKDDSQVVDERVIKTYAEKAIIMVRWEEL